MVEIIDGRKIAEEILALIKEGVKSFKTVPRLAAVMVGEDLASLSFLKQKELSAQKAGIAFRLYKFPEDISSKKLRKEINQISKLRANSGIIIQLPLSENINQQYILNAIPEEKDVDVLSQKSLGAFYANRSIILPPSVAALKEIFERYNITVQGKNIVIVGSGFLIGQPIAHWLMLQQATISALNEFSKDLSFYTKEADIIISGAGKWDLIKGDMVKEGVVAIDYGFSTEDGGPIRGDFNFEEVSKKASLITPVPGGMGPIVVATLFKNLITLIKHGQRKKGK